MSTQKNNRGSYVASNSMMQFMKSAGAVGLVAKPKASTKAFVFKNKN
jgi:hypothetical protein